METCEFSKSADVTVWLQYRLEPVNMVVCAKKNNKHGGDTVNYIVKWSLREQAKWDMTNWQATMSFDGRNLE